MFRCSVPNYRRIRTSRYDQVSIDAFAFSSRVRLLRSYHKTFYISIKTHKKNYSCKCSCIKYFRWWWRFESQQVLSRFTFYRIPCRVDKDRFFIWVILFKNFIIHSYCGELASDDWFIIAFLWGWTPFTLLDLRRTNCISSWFELGVTGGVAFAGHWSQLCRLTEIWLAYII